MTVLPEREEGISPTESFSPTMVPKIERPSKSGVCVPDEPPVEALVKALCPTPFCCDIENQRCRSILDASVVVIMMMMMMIKARGVLVKGEKEKRRARVGGLLTMDVWWGEDQVAKRVVGFRNGSQLK
jgi:hypothetical protein